MLPDRRRFLQASAAFSAAVLAGCTRHQLPDHVAPDRYVPPPAVGAELRLVVLGDWGSGQIEQWQVAQGMEAAAASLGGFHAGLLLGDNFYPGGVDSVKDPLWRLYFEQVYDTPHLGQMPWHGVLGNHDYGGNAGAQIEYSRVNPRWRMPCEYWAHTFTGENARPLLKVIGVDTNKEFERWPEQMEFLELELKQSAVRAVVIGHHPVFTAGKLGAAPRVKTELRERLTAAGVAAFIAGHEHNHQFIVRDGLNQLIQGGGGKTLTPLPWVESTPGLRFWREDYGFSVLRASAAGIRFDWRDRHGSVLHEVEL